MEEKENKKPQEEQQGLRTDVVWADPVNKKIIKSFLALAAIVAVVAVYFLSSQGPDKIKTANDKVNEARQANAIGGNIVLTDQDGKIFDTKTIGDKMRIVYFGFSRCPDICPASMQKLSDVMEILDKYRIDVTPIFISIDPERDESDMLKDFLAPYHPKFIALTGTPQGIKKVADKYKIYYAKGKEDKAKGDYVVDHSSFIYVLDKNDEYLQHFNLDSKPEEIANFIRINNNK